MRFLAAAIGLGLASLVTAPPAHAQEPPRGISAARQALAQAAPDAPIRRRPRVRIFQRQIDERGVYPSYNPGPNAVRDCTASYAPEYRPSGTVITPRVSCVWRRG